MFVDFDVQSRIINCQWQPQHSHKLHRILHPIKNSNNVTHLRTIPSPLAPLSLPPLLITAMLLLEALTRQ